MIEQLLGRHPLVQIGGELELIPALVHERLTPYPAALRTLDADTRRDLRGAYLQTVTSNFPDARYVTDKRPDNFLHIGLIKTLFLAGDNWPMILRDWARFYIEGCHAVTPFSRAVPPEALDARIKNRSRMAYTLAEAEVKLVDPQAQSILLDIHGNVAENKGGNFFIYADGVLKTPQARSAQAGISRATVLELAANLGIPTQVTDFQPYDIYTADEAFFTSTPYCIMPATKFNGLPVGDGTVGTISKRLLQAWSELVGVDIVAQGLSFLS